MLKEKRRLQLAMLVTLAVISATGLFIHQTAHARENDEAAVRDALMKSAASFEKNDLAMASQVWANDESLTVFESGHANYAGPTIVTIIWFRKWAR